MPRAVKLDQTSITEVIKRLLWHFWQYFRKQRDLKIWCTKNDDPFGLSCSFFAMFNSRNKGREVEQIIYVKLRDPWERNAHDAYGVSQKPNF